MFRWFRKHTRDGMELPDPTPTALSLTAERPLTLAEQMARFIRNPEVVDALRNRGVDTFDEADDFDTGDLEPQDFQSPYELEFEGSETRVGVQTRLDECKSGMVEEMPLDRQERAKERMKRRPGKVEDEKAGAKEQNAGGKGT